MNSINILLKTFAYFIIIFLLVFCYCSQTNNKDFISSAIVETQTYQIATTAQGTIVSLFKDEGDRVEAGELVAIIDTIPLVLKLNEINAALVELTNNINAKKTEVLSWESDLKGIEREYKRIATLVEQGSVPSQQKDNLETQLNSSNLRYKANQSLLLSLIAKANTINTQKSQLLDQISRCYVRSPASGIVFTKYKNNGEVVLPGNPILELGRIDTMRIDFYVTQPMLPLFSCGQNVRVRIDYESKEVKHKEIFLPAKISWISSEAEFSPKNIQTRESRNELVYKIRAIVENKNGILKRGLPVEIWK
jgi:HlyD family secretion protein